MNIDYERFYNGNKQGGEVVTQEGRFIERNRGQLCRGAGQWNEHSAGAAQNSGYRDRCGQGSPG